MRKPAFCICANKDAYQLRSNHTADQRLCFRYMGSTIWFVSDLVGNQTGFLMTWLIYNTFGKLFFPLMCFAPQEMCQE